MTQAERDLNNRDSQSVDSAELSLLRAIVEGTAPKTGEDFFRTLVRNLCTATGARGAFVAKLTHAGTRVRPIAYWDSGAFSSLEDWELAGTPCEEVVRGELCHYASGVSKRYPQEVGIESYLGVPLLGARGECLGHLAMLDEVAMPMAPRLIFTFKIFAARATAELDRLQAVDRLHASEERFRDLFDEAPIAYVHEDLESRFIRANRTAMRVLGLNHEDIDGMVGITLAADSEDAQRRVREAFESVNRGIDTSGVILEMRRKNDGAQVFIEWWSRPDPSGEYTRTMFIDVTERVLMEREQARLKAENLYFQNEISAVQNFDGVVGKSKAIRAVLGEVRRVAKTNATVLIRGETGTGKELIARAIHNASDRRDKPLIKVNCAALPSEIGRAHV